ncbi:hypothetical protein BpHYR1_046921 [Brachionus plicatilis]|uniref:Transmembrane protein n=1 Tax=Brachionus plicatilis TaxID=10195 RepID=A0A3M7SM49_BRAPC|nr:hypothetical protein BpHYR1_046921 [Brachionus plicatilis]
MMLCRLQEFFQGLNLAGKKFVSAYTYCRTIFRLKIKLIKIYSFSTFVIILIGHLLTLVQIFKKKSFLVEYNQANLYFNGNNFTLKQHLISGSRKFNLQPAVLSLFVLSN